ncbi:MAG: hypothetical protein LBK60_04390 [Verrucomicrobiales bacterium]|jgi:hypothetical protein|nr:hypothetical protein [Verrucomicrobiales bacterium]
MQKRANLTMRRRVKMGLKKRGNSDCAELFRTPERQNARTPERQNARTPERQNARTRCIYQRWRLLVTSVVHMVNLWHVHVAVKELFSPT